MMPTAWDRLVALHSAQRNPKLGQPVVSNCGCTAMFISRLQRIVLYSRLVILVIRIHRRNWWVFTGFSGIDSWILTVETGGTEPGTERVVCGMTLPGRETLRGLDPFSGYKGNIIPPFLHRNLSIHILTHCHNHLFVHFHCFTRLSRPVSWHISRSGWAGESIFDCLAGGFVFEKRCRKTCGLIYFIILLNFNNYYS